MGDVTDREKWNMAVAAVADEFSRLSPARRDEIGTAAEEIRSCKEAIQGVAERVAAAEICASCGGECCRTGKYHFEVADLLVYLAGGRDLFMPRYDQDACPYLGAKGCLMEPGWRPVNCISFNCDRVESLIDPRELERMTGLERGLREGCRRIERLFDSPYYRGPLLMSWERVPDRGRSVSPLTTSYTTGEIDGELTRSGAGPH